jgi:hypothetical protein
MITIDGDKHLVITCTEQAEIDAIARACRVISIGHRMTATVNRSEYARVCGIAERCNRRAAEPVVEVAMAPAPANRIMVGVGEFGPRAPKLLNGMNFSGYGTVFRIDADRAAASGIEPQYEHACYAYYR